MQTNERETETSGGSGKEAFSSLKGVAEELGKVRIKGTADHCI